MLLRPEQSRRGIHLFFTPPPQKKNKKPALGLIYLEALPVSQIAAYLVLLRPRFPSVHLLYNVFGNFRAGFAVEIV